MSKATVNTEREGKAMAATQQPFNWDGREGRETISEMVELLAQFVERFGKTDPEANALIADAQAVTTKAWNIGI